VTPETLFDGAPRAFIANVDGASRGNPGPAAAGWVIRDASDGQVIIEEGLFLGKETNNRAEYFALLFAVEDAMLLGATELTIRSDSELLVRQMLGRYRVKNRDLKPLFQRVKRLSGYFGAFHVEHVSREDNREADKAANQALNEAGE